MVDKRKYLYEELSELMRVNRLPYSDIPDYITDNLKFDLYEWQKNALINFFDYLKVLEFRENINPVHLLFNMATGTGKTLLMAALILYYFKQGKRHFIFFVNQNNIVGKTEDNLTDPSHNKYLYKKTIVIDDKSVKIRKVDNFSDHSDDIQILFTSIHKLHNAVYAIKEDSIFLDDLQKRDLIMLGDEAHHLNAATKKNKKQIELELITELADNASQETIERSWEHTVIELILNKGKKNQYQPNNNALLEFTATVPTEKEVVEKYIEKTICKFDLKDFLKAGYTKEINLVSSSFDKKKRIMQALLFNWYRYKIAVENGLVNFKPVILFRSKFIDKAQESNSEEDYEYFLDIINNLTAVDFNFLNEFDEKELFDITETYQKGKSRIIDIKRYIKGDGISLKDIIEYLKHAFNERNCIITNSKTGTKTKEKTDEETERLLNSLEDKDNHIRAIFTVKRLTEGWDVLNLYDIVRLYEGRDEGATSSGRKAGQATVSEVQLIGRGVRYYPFPFEDKEVRKRKFDSNLDHELRVLEEFYFHSDDDHRYINELKRELKKQELLPENDKVIKKFQLKLDFEQSDFYKDVKLYQNEPQDNPGKRKRTLDEIRNDFEFEYKIERFGLSETKVILDKKEDEIRLKAGDTESNTLSKKLKDFERHIIRKAINVNAKKDNSILRFNKLRDVLAIDSVDDILKDVFLGTFPVMLITQKPITKLEQLDNAIQLQALIAFFGKVAGELKYISNPTIGSEFKPVAFKDYSDWKKEKSVVEEPENDYLHEELVKKKWYVLDGFHGTSEERNLIEFLKDTMGNFENHYEEVYLLRNEEVYKIYDFEKGRGFQPDFLLFLKEKKKKLYYQVFIEPKGSQFKDAADGFKDSKEGWKEKFLEQITDKYGIKQVLKAENKDYKLIGLPLYNQKTSKVFKDAVKNNLIIEL